MSQREGIPTVHTMKGVDEGKEVIRGRDEGRSIKQSCMHVFSLPIPMRANGGGEGEGGGWREEKAYYGQIHNARAYTHLYARHTHAVRYHCKNIDQCFAAVMAEQADGGRIKQSSEAVGKN